MYVVYTNYIIGEWERVDLMCSTAEIFLNSTHVRPLPVPMYKIHMDPLGLPALRTNVKPVKWTVAILSLSKLPVQWSNALMLPKLRVQPVRRHLAFEMPEERTQLGEGGVCLQRQPSTTEKHAFLDVTVCSQHPCSNRGQHWRRQEREAHLL